MPVYLSHSCASRNPTNNCASSARFIMKYLLGWIPACAGMTSKTAGVLYLFMVTAKNALRGIFSDGNEKV